MHKGSLRAAASGLVLTALIGTHPAASQQTARASNQGADARADLILKRMTQDEKIAMVHGFFPKMMKARPQDVALSAGYVPGVARLGVPALRESDASLGVAAAGREDDPVTPLPSSLSLAASWNPDVAFAGGAMIGKEARQMGFNVLLAGGVNLTRDAYNGRNFEYLGEDPLLAGTMAGASISGVQSQHLVSTAKHFVLNAQETGRYVLDARIDEAALRESDLLAFEIVLEKGHPGSVMCAYNRVNGPYACENPHTLTATLKGDWGWKGWVMSDWGAVHSVQAANAGLDQESGADIDREVYFDAPLRASLASGETPQTRLDDMVHRILRSMIANGLMDHPVVAGPVDLKADGAVARTAGAAGIVLLKNQGGLLPLAASAGRILVIGAHADQGVLSGGGSSAVVPKGALRLPIPAGAPAWVKEVVYHPSSPLKAIQARAPGAQLTYDSGDDPGAAAAAAKGADVVLLFADQWTSEAIDTAISLPKAQEALIAAVTAANPRTVVVLETGGPVLMPWLDHSAAVLETWYPGGRGGEAIADVLFGDVNPSGRLPITFPARADQLPRSEPVGLDPSPPPPAKSKVPTTFPVDYVEGSSVGYRWFAQKGQTPLFPFGYGLSYTRFRYGDIKVTGGQTLTVSVAVTNTGSRAGIETAQVYLREGPNRRQQRLLGWARVSLKPGQTQRVRITADRRLLANWDEAAHGWRLDGGRYAVFAGPNALEAPVQGAADVQGAMLKP